MRNLKNEREIFAYSFNGGGEWVMEMPFLIRKHSLGASMIFLQSKNDKAASHCMRWLEKYKITFGVFDGVNFTDINSFRSEILKLTHEQRFIARNEIIELLSAMKRKLS